MEVKGGVTWLFRSAQSVKAVEACCVIRCSIGLLRGIDHGGEATADDCGVRTFTSTTTC